ncbi:ATPase [Mycobacterium sp. OTB74]|jgi:hypothetical protein|uniref:ATPase n=1 Tax=Mycobacterium sp. OTB74 TaxID=1853452 RepID=UPI0024746662|nr:ATPase [Mycobacterium sp. OTB74]MDH6244210.1 hypothetical protein [Mycobacterium sp. OTB74]
MADKGDGSPRTGAGRQRLKTLTQAALNADMTVGQVETILVDLSNTLADLDRATEALEATMARFNDTIDKIEVLPPKMLTVVERMESIVGRVEVIVGVAETFVSPIAATENAVRGILTALRSRS